VSHVSSLTHPDLVVEHYPQVKVVGRIAHVVQGVSAANRILKINNPDIGTLKCALLERMYYCKVGNRFRPPPATCKKYIFKKLQKFRAVLLHKFGPPPTKISPEEFSQMYFGRKKTIYENAVKEYSIYGVSKKDSHSNPFVKCEKVKPGGAPRCIQPRRPKYNVAVGRYLKHIEHRMYRAIKRCFGDGTNVVLKGMNTHEIALELHAKWSMFDNPVAIGLDATKFDMHVSEGMLEWEHSIYNALYNWDSELVKLLSWQRVNSGTGFCGDGKLKYRVRGRRFSGDMNTALGNCIIMCAMVYTYARERGVTISLANNGDDCMVFMEQGDLSRFMLDFNEWFLTMGFRMTVEEPCYSLENIEFCQMHPINLGSHWVMVRNFETAREKDSLSIIPIDTEGAYRKWLGAVGECGLALASGVPVVQSIYEAYCRYGEKSQMSASVAFQGGFLWLSARLDSRSSVISEEARYSFFLAFGITPDEQVSLEKYYAGLNLSFGPTISEDFDEMHSAPF